MRRLDYLPGLGVTCVWLQPFYPSPNRDNGYDVTDYYNVHEKHGSLGDFVNFMKHADALGIRVIVDLVVNHTSIDSPWFQQARSDPKSLFRDWYVWADQRPEESQGRHRLSRASRRRPGRATAGRRVLLPPLLRAPGRPEHLEPVRARRDPEDHGLLAAARRVRLPHGRRAVPDREEGGRRRAPEGLQSAEGDARLPAVALGRRHHAGRSERAAGREPGVLRRRGRAAADDAELLRSTSGCSTPWPPGTSIR